MIWVAWGQFRTQALVTLGLLAAFTVLVLVTGLHLRDSHSASLAPTGSADATPPSTAPAAFNDNSKRSATQ